MPIRISSAINGFRRAGVAHPNRPTVYPDGYFSDAQIKQLKAEPRLAVEFGNFETADPTDQGAGQEGAVEPDSVSDGVNDADQDDTVEPDRTPDGESEGYLEGVVEPDGTEKSLEEMEEDEVRQLGKELGIRSYHNMGLDKLIEKIREEKVQVPAEGEA